MELDHILITGAREHNLQDVDVAIPKKKLVVLPAFQARVKPSLAFDTLYAEGQRRYVESLSAYACQRSSAVSTSPCYDAMRGLAPTISIEQKTAGSNPRSTVGTITEISDYFARPLCARGRPTLPGVQKAGESTKPQKIAADLANLGEGKRLILLVSLLENRKRGAPRTARRRARRGIVRLRVDGEMVDSEGLEALDKRKKHDVLAVIDRLVVGKASLARITESVEKALREGKGELVAEIDGKDRIYPSARLVAASPIPSCRHRAFPSITPKACVPLAPASARKWGSIRPRLMCRIHRSASMKAPSSSGAPTSRRRTPAGATEPDCKS